MRKLEKTHLNGLTTEEVEFRKQQGLVNVTEECITKTTGQIIFDNVFTLFNAFNTIIALCLAFVSAWLDMTFYAIIVLNALVGIVQEIRAKKLVENLTLISALKATVVRDSKEQEINVDEIVADDVVILDMGSQICADSKVLESEIEGNESLLTGESEPVIKLPGDTLLSGSFVISGKCYSVVENVGSANFASKIVCEAKAHKKVKSELLGAISTITKFTSYFVAPIGIILFLEARFIDHSSIHDSVVSASAGVLGILPKGLVLLITFNLIVSLIRLSRKKVLVQGLHSIETFAYVDTLCLDKTGTITEGKMTVQKVYDIDTKILPVTLDELLGSYISSVTDNNSTFLAMKEHFGENNSYKPIDTTPFSSERKWGAVSFKDIGTLYLGAPERLFSDKYELPKEIKKAQESGNRVLFIGFSKSKVVDDSLNNITPVGAIEISDPIRKNAKQTLDFFKQEGVDVKIISGDNPITVSNVAKKAGLASYADYVDMSKVDDKDFANVAKKYSVFGRVTPDQKKYLVQAFKADGRTVAMTGDGVNDVLALKEADCSIAMAAGSDAAKQVAQLVLLDSDFSSLKQLVKDGRRVINNVTRFGGVFIVKTILSFLLAIFSVATLKEYPFLPIQITLYDCFIEGWFSFIMSFENNTERVDGRFLTNIIKKGLPFAIITFINIVVVYTAYPHFNLPLPEAKTVMYFTMASITLLAVLNACRPFNKLRWFVGITTVLGFFSAAYLFHGLLKIEPLTNLGVKALGIGIIISIPLILLLIFITKKVSRKIA